MPIDPGFCFDHYEILAPIGKGGMGDVYRARDTRLNRDVAVKVLPAEFALDSDRLGRFGQEARATSALNHPNILTVYDFGTHEGHPYLVMELLEGQELRAHLGDGAISVRRAIDYAQQIAAGLAAAHEKGVVHRDLKPENLFVTKDNRVKILDFGLAKLRPPQDAPAGSVVATQKQLTNPGTVMGTVAYMSPEQVRGQDLEQRSDIFSFGLILFEMLSGKHAFTGESAVEVMNAILKEDPPAWDESQVKVPPAVDRIVRRCLEKKPEHRFHSAHDLAYALEAVAASSSSGSNQTAVGHAVETTTLSNGWGGRERILLIVSSVLAVALLSLGVAWLRRAEPPASHTVRFSLFAPEKSSLVEPSFALSPDGQQLAFSATDATEKTLLYVRPLNSFTAQPLPGTEDAMLPFWSPDGRSVAFFSGGKLKRIEVSGGLPQTLCDASLAVGGSWSRVGEIVMAPAGNGVLYRVAATGGVPTALTTLDESRGEVSHWLPQFLPDGDHFLFYAVGKQSGQSGVCVGSLSEKRTSLVLNTDRRALYTSGYLLFVKNGALMGQAFNPSNLELAGEPFLIMEQLKTTAYVLPHLSVAENGTLAFQSGVMQPPQLVRFDRGGKQLGTVGESADYSNPSLAPNGERLAIGIRDPKTTKRDIWLFDLSRGVKSRFTFDTADDLNPVWSTDGSRIFFSSDRKGQRDIFEKKVNSAEEEQLIYSSPENKNVCDVSPDGRLLIYNTNPTSSNDTAKNDLWLLPLEGEQTPRPFLKTQFNEDQAAISPDGKRVAYRSDESGRDEIYVATFPQLINKWQVSVDGGAEPRWRRDGNELFFTDAGRKLMAAQVKSGTGAFVTAVPVLLFETQLLTVPARNRFVVTGDGQQFILVTRLEAPEPINVVLNWTAEIKK
ncbi:MAG TPA: protein kinase [Blastocatellia bacterium]|nr:protein kinase [Blastocatellia bacterium]